MNPTTPRESALAARDFRRMLPDHASVYRPSAARSASGGTTYTYPVAPAFSVAARITPMGLEIEQFFADKLGGEQGWTGTFPVAYEPTLRDRVKVHGRTFEVIGSNLGRTTDMVRRVPMREIT